MILDIPCVGKKKEEFVLGEHVILYLIKPYKNKGLKAITDKFFTFLRLDRKLLQRSITNVVIKKHINLKVRPKSYKLEKAHY